MTPYLIPFILFCQALGALSGAFMAVWGEIAYVRALRDGHIDQAEHAHLRVIARGLRWGMSLLLLASLALVVTAYVSGAATVPALMPDYWALISLAFVVIYASWALSRRRVSFALGSALVFAGWWFLVYLTLGLFPALSYGAMVAFFVVSVGIFYAILHWARSLAGRVDPEQAG